MIFDAVLTWFTASVLVPGIQAIPVPGVPAFVWGATDTIGTAFAMAAQLCGWVSWELVGPAIAVAFLGWSGGLILKIAKMVVGAFFPGGLH